jgi:4-oxalocrotonate tautomerase
MPIVKIDLWEGRTPEQKEKMIAAVTKAVCESIGCPPQSVQVLIQDYKKSDWGLDGKPGRRISS